MAKRLATTPDDGRWSAGLPSSLYDMIWSHLPSRTMLTTIEHMNHHWKTLSQTNGCGWLRLDLDTFALQHRYRSTRKDWYGHLRWPVLMALLLQHPPRLHAVRHINGAIRSLFDFITLLEFVGSRVMSLDVAVTHLINRTIGDDDIDHEEGDDDDDSLHQYTSTSMKRSVPLLKRVSQLLQPSHAPRLTSLIWKLLMNSNYDDADAANAPVVTIPSMPNLQHLHLSGYPHAMIWEIEPMASLRVMHVANIVHLVSPPSPSPPRAPVAPVASSSSVPLSPWASAASWVFQPSDCSASYRASSPPLWCAQLTSFSYAFHANDSVLGTVTMGIILAAARSSLRSLDISVRDIVEWSDQWCSSLSKAIKRYTHNSHKSDSSDDANNSLQLESCRITTNNWQQTIQLVLPIWHACRSSLTHIIMPSCVEAPQVAALIRASLDDGAQAKPMDVTNDNNTDAWNMMITSLSSLKKLTTIDFHAWRIDTVGCHDDELTLPSRLSLITSLPHVQYIIEKRERLATATNGGIVTKHCARAIAWSRDDWITMITPECDAIQQQQHATIRTIAETRERVRLAAAHDAAIAEQRAVELAARVAVAKARQKEIDDTVAAQAQQQLQLQQYLAIQQAMAQQLQLQHDTQQQAAIAQWYQQQMMTQAYIAAAQRAAPPPPPGITWQQAQLMFPSAPAFPPPQPPRAP